MLVSREESTFDVGAARFDLGRDREIVGAFVSHLLSDAVRAARLPAQGDRFPTRYSEPLARRADDQTMHVRVYLRILDSLGIPPAPAHRDPRALVLDAGSGTLVERCFVEMALGHGFSLMLCYLLIDTLPDSEVQTLLKAVALQQQPHVSFGEERTTEALNADPAMARHLLGLAIAKISVDRRMISWLQRINPEHPVLERMPAFEDHATKVHELRMRRIGITQADVGFFTQMERALLVAGSVGRRAARALNLQLPSSKKLVKQNGTSGLGHDR